MVAIFAKGKSSAKHGGDEEGGSSHHDKKKKNKKHHDNELIGTIDRVGKQQMGASPRPTTLRSCWKGCARTTASQ